MLTCQAGEKGTGHLTPSDLRGQWHTSVNVNCPTGKTPEPGKQKKEPLAVNALESKEDFQYVNLTVSKTTAALGVAQGQSQCQTSMFTGRRKET